MTTDDVFRVSPAIAPQGRGCIKIKYLKLSSFWKEESPKGEVVGKKIQNIDIQTIVKTYHPA